MKFSLPRGFRDIPPEDYALMEEIRGAFIETCRLFGFNLMEPSPLEMLETLEAKSGPSIRDEIFAFRDKSGREVGLRFDLTVGLTRWVVSNRSLQLPVKIGSFGGLWRYDEPQYGRYRWFYQWDAEIFGPTTVDADAEVIDFTYTLFRRLGLDVFLYIGDRRVVSEFIKKMVGVEDESTLAEMLRALDKIKKKSKQEILDEYASKVDPSKLIKLLEFGEISGLHEDVMKRLGEYQLASTSTLAELIDLLKQREVKNIVVDLSIVRGLDYYTGIVFEAYTRSDQAVGALAGGGRYDILPAIFGRPDIGATGVAGGVDRTILVLKKRAIKKRFEQLIYVAYVSKEVSGAAQKIAATLRREGLAAEIDLSNRSLKKQLETAAKRNTPFVIIVGPKELAANKVVLRDMMEGKEEEKPITEIVNYLKQILKT
jgi:histidyl-tRNA synthetase